MTCWPLSSVYVLAKQWAPGKRQLFYCPGLVYLSVRDFNKLTFPGACFYAHGTRSLFSASPFTAQSVGRWVREGKKAFVETNLVEAALVEATLVETTFVKTHARAGISSPGPAKRIANFAPAWLRPVRNIAIR